MTVKDILDKIDNGSAHAFIWDYETGEVLLETIWYNQIDKQIMGKEVVRICVRDYEIRLGVK